MKFIHIKIKHVPLMSQPPLSRHKCKLVDRIITLCHLSISFHKALLSAKLLSLSYRNIFSTVGCFFDQNSGKLIDPFLIPFSPNCFVCYLDKINSILHIYTKYFYFAINYYVTIFELVSSLYNITLTFNVD